MLSQQFIVAACTKCWQPLLHRDVPASKPAEVCFDSPPLLSNSAAVFHLKDLRLFLDKRSFQKLHVHVHTTCSYMYNNWWQTGWCYGVWDVSQLCKIYGGHWNSWSSSAMTLWRTCVFIICHNISCDIKFWLVFGARKFFVGSEIFRKYDVNWVVR